LGSNRAPDSIGPDQQIGTRRGAVSQGHRDTLAFSVRLVALDRIAVLNEIGFDFPALVNQDFLQIGSINHTRVREAK
jgi:hypothetical protein